MARHAPRPARAPIALPALLYQNDPIRRSVERLGAKWTLLIIRDLAFLRLRRFGEFRRNNPGLSPRVLSRRLREMQREGLILRDGSGSSVRYRLSSRGEDAAFVLLALLRYGLKHAVGPQPPEPLPRSGWESRTNPGDLTGGKLLPGRPEGPRHRDGGIGLTGT